MMVVCYSGLSFRAKICFWGFTFALQLALSLLWFFSVAFSTEYLQSKLIFPRKKFLEMRWLISWNNHSGNLYKAIYYISPSFAPFCCDQQDLMCCLLVTKKTNHKLNAQCRASYEHISPYESGKNSHFYVFPGKLHLKATQEICVTTLSFSFCHT